MFPSINSPIVLPSVLLLFYLSVPNNHLYKTQLKWPTIPEFRRLRMMCYLWSLESPGHSYFYLNRHPWWSSSLLSSICVYKIKKWISITFTFYIHRNIQGLCAAITINLWHVYLIESRVTSRFVDIIISKFHHCHFTGSKHSLAKVFNIQARQHNGLLLLRPWGFFMD